MAEPKNEGPEYEERENAMPAKRKPDLVAVAESADGESVKKQKSEPEPQFTNGTDSSLVSKGKQIAVEYEDEEDEEDEYYELTDTDEEDDDDSDEEEEDDDEDEVGDGEKDEKSNGKAAAVDRKGKGILIEEKKSDDSDDDDDIDLVEDPLAEVDLDNILPTKTRGGGFRRSGISISDKAGNNHNSKSNPN